MLSWRFGCQAKNIIIGSSLVVYLSIEVTMEMISIEYMGVETHYHPRVIDMSSGFEESMELNMCTREDTNRCYFRRRAVLNWLEIMDSPVESSNDRFVYLLSLEL